MAICTMVVVVVLVVDKMEPWEAKIGFNILPT